MQAFLREQIDRLIQTAPKTEPTVNRPAKPAYTPLRDQITAIFREMPLALKARPWSVYELTAQLQGKYRSNPHPQDVARNLRDLGWTASRSWSKEGYGKRIWHPPV